MEEEIQIINENTTKEKFKNFFVKNSKYLIFSISAIIILILAYFVYLEINSRNQSKLAEEYNYIVNNFNNLQNSEQSTERLIRIIEKKNSTYSPLSLYFILDNELVTEKNEINKYFDMVINIGSLEKEIKNLNIYPKNMKRNLDITNGIFFSQRVLLELTTAGFTREQSYKIVQRNAMQAWKENSSFYDKIISDRQVTKKIPVNKLKKLFDFSYHTKKINIIFKRILKN